MKLLFLSISHHCVEIDALDLITGFEEGGTEWLFLLKALSFCSHTYFHVDSL